MPLPPGLKLSIIVINNRASGVEHPPGDAARRQATAAQFQTCIKVRFRARNQGNQG
jgi:hypothetical protein